MTEEEKNLRDLLAKSFYLREQRLRMLEDMGIDSLLPYNVNVDAQSPRDFWHDVVRKASMGVNLMALVEAALRESPGNPNFLIARKGIEFLSERRGPDEFAVTALDAASLEALTSAVTTLMPIRFLSRGMDRARSVACIFRDVFPQGTGWLLPGNWLVTNHHVLPDETTALASTAHFAYEEDVLGQPVASQPFDLDPAAGFHTSPVRDGNDWTVVKVKGDANSAFGSLHIGTKSPIIGDYVNIIQHPGGRRKEIGLYHNTVTATTSTRIQYLTDTEPGSSGSPVFNCNWEVVALHHASKDLRNTNTMNQIVNQGIAGGLLRQELERIGILNSLPCSTNSV